MDAETAEIIDSCPEIDRAVAILVRLLARAAAENQHGVVGISLSVHNGKVRKQKVTTEIWHNY